MRPCPKCGRALMSTDYEKGVVTFKCSNEWCDYTVQKLRLAKGSR
jgi:hypothetical protein